MTTITDEAATAGDGTPAPGFVTDLIDVAAFYAVHPSAPRPTPRLNIPVPPGPRGRRVAALQEIADAIGAEVLPHLGQDGEPDGTLIAERRFGDVIVEAHLCDPDRRVSTILARAAAIRAAQAGNEAAA